MLIYNSIDQDEKLISKMKSFVKNKYIPLQKSIEKQAHHSCVILFSVYLKFYRRINLARYELTQNDDKKPHRKLLSLFEYTTHVFNLFSKTKGQDGNCNELYEQIKMNSLFLLKSIKESDLIPLVEYQTKVKLIRQYSKRKVKEYNIRLIGNTFLACRKFKKLILSKRKLNEIKQKNEYILRRSIEDFIFNEKKFNINEFLQCLSKQNQRALSRLIAYEFSSKSIEKMFKLENKNLLKIYLCYLRKPNMDWTYLENISSINIQLKENIAKNYYLIIEKSLELLNYDETLFYLINLSYQLSDIYYLYKSKFFDNFCQNSNFLRYNWFRLYVYKFCEHFHEESNLLLNEIRDFIFNKIILKELKSFEQLSTTNIDSKLSLISISIDWFIKANENQNLSSTFYINQYLHILLRCVQHYEHVQSFCATFQYIDRLIYIYQNSTNSITRLLILKILRKLIIYLPDNLNEQSRSMIDNFLIYILSSINRTTIEITTELIYIYRTLISFESLWQMKAIVLISNFLSLKFQSIDNLLACLCILGSYIHSFCLGAVVEIHDTNETQRGIIVEINSDSEDLNAKPFRIQLIETNEIKSFGIDQLKLEIDVPPPNLLDLPVENEFIGLLFDSLLDFIQTDDSNVNRLLLLQLKRQSICVLYRLLNHKRLVDIFLQKPYVSVIARLSVSALEFKTQQQSIDLHSLNKYQLEEYCLSLDRCKTFTQPSTDDYVIWTKIPFKLDLFTMSKRDLNLFKKGRHGKDEIKIREFTSKLRENWFQEECGVIHQFPGRIHLVSNNADSLSATFVIEDLQLTEGDWYFCVRLLESTSANIGWATQGFTTNNHVHLGHDRYSWSYNGSEGLIYNGELYPFAFDQVRWSANDVCGCGIEIHDDSIKINYWLNGCFLGTAFAHNLPFPSSTSVCNMLPNGGRTDYFPAVTLNVNETSVLSSCEFIFHPMDMFECPLPIGYKPLMIPNLVDFDDLLVPYPFNSYLISHSSEDNFENKNSTTKFLRDFINNNHLENKFEFDNDYYLFLPEQSQGFSLTVNNKESTTISFDFSLPKMPNNCHDILLLTFNTNSIRIPINKIVNPTQIVIIFEINQQKLKVYIKNELRMVKCSIVEKFTIYILPRISVRIQNVAIWKYALSNEHIQRLFTSGLSYIVNDYHQIRNYRKSINSFTFNGNNFENDFINVVNDNESLQLFGNKSHLILSKSNDSWSEYTFIFDVIIHSLPITIIGLNAQTKISITSDVICVHHKSIRIYANGLLILDNSLETQFLTITDKEIEIFKESDSKDTIRIECKSITYLNKTLNEIDEKFASSNPSLENLIELPYSIISPSLMRIGYSEAAIKLAMKLKKINSIENVARILREKKCGTTILSKLGFIINYEKLKDFSEFSQYNSEECLTELVEILLLHWNNIVTEPINLSSQNWFQEAVQYLNINSNLTEWLQDESATKIEQKNDLTCQVLDLDQESNQEELKFDSNIDYLHRNITEEKYIEYRIACEYSLISIYAHYLILNMLKIFSYDGSCLFPLEKLGDCTFIMKLLRLLDYHYRYKRLHTDETVDRMSLLISSILKIELNELLSSTTDSHMDMKRDILQIKAPLLYHLQKDIVIQSINFFSNPSLLSSSESNDEHNVNKPNFEFILKSIHLLIKLISEKSIHKHKHTDLLISFLFPECLIRSLFNLFLIHPKHENKIHILRIFSTLIQMSQNFQLNLSIQSFLFHLFLELPPNSTLLNTQTMRTFHISLIDCIFLLIEKDSINEINKLYKLPKNFYDLMIIDVINALLDKTQRTLFPDSFLMESINLLGDVFQLTKEDVEQSNHYFDTLSDSQLIHFMNNNELLNASFTEFILSLPTESTPNPSYYKTYPSLWHIPAISIHIRSRTIYAFNRLFDRILPFIDLSLFSRQSIIMDKIQKVKSYILYNTKSQLFNSTLHMTLLTTTSSIPTVNFDTIKISSTDETMFLQAFEQLYQNAHTTFRQEHERVWRAQYLGMHSTDQGGPFRDSVTCICSDVCSTRLSLFILCPNGRTNIGLNNDRWIPNIYPPNASIPIRIKQQYQFIGQLMGMAIRQKHYLNLKFPSLLWKQLVREQITMEDIENIDIQSFKIINEMEKSINQNNSSIDNNESLNNLLDELRYEVVSSNGQTYELVPNGKNIPITISNYKDYCAIYREYRLNEFHRQIECIRQGLYSTVPGYFLSLFTANEIEELVCGKGEMDVDLLRRNTVYSGRYNQNLPVIQHFWTILRNIFNEEQRKLFLKFVWGRCTLPSCDDDFETKFFIEPYNQPRELIDKTLPRAHTCTFVLDLPEYSTIDIMYDRLNYAITYCITIDGDGNMDETVVSSDSDLDSSDDDDDE
ncbi:unnamed protein product [Rotaria sp. Silwood1]|nr:unnamed protein product [Rotaria sp. Silwood1]